jgi:hypothetical protein
LEVLARAPAHLARAPGARSARGAALRALLASGALLRLRLQRADGSALLLAPDDEAPLEGAAARSPPSAPLLLLAEWAPTTLAPFCAAVVAAAAEAAAAAAGSSSGGGGGGAGALPQPPPPWAPAPALWTSPPMHAPLWMVAVGHRLPALRVEWGCGALKSVRVTRPVPPPLSPGDLTFLATAVFQAVTEAYPGVSLLGARPAHAARAEGAAAAPRGAGGGGGGGAALSPPRHALRALTADAPAPEGGEGAPADSAPSPPPPPLSLHDLLADFTRAEALPREEGWACPGCSARVAATKRLTLWAPPPLLLVHLKRFAFGAAGGKIAAQVDAPPLLDLGAWFATCGPPTARALEVAPAAAGAAALLPAALAVAEAGAAAAAAEEGASPLAVALGAPAPTAPADAQQQQQQPLLYELLAVVNHHGESAQSGHYTTVYRAEKKGGGEPVWVNADDARLSVVGVGADPAFVAGALDDAYILLYARKGPAK